MRQQLEKASETVNCHVNKEYPNSCSLRWKSWKGDADQQKASEEALALPYDWVATLQAKYSGNNSCEGLDSRILVDVMRESVRSPRTSRSSWRMLDVVL